MEMSRYPPQVQKPITKVVITSRTINPEDSVPVQSGRKLAARMEEEGPFKCACAPRR